MYLASGLAGTHELLDQDATSQRADLAMRRVSAVEELKAVLARHGAPTHAILNAAVTP
jgi:hypothetical protein